VIFFTTPASDFAPQAGTLLEIERELEEAALYYWK